jgi:hypothetical protein
MIASTPPVPSGALRGLAIPPVRTVVPADDGAIRKGDPEEEKLASRRSTRDPRREKAQKVAKARWANWASKKVL